MAAYDIHAQSNVRIDLMSEVGQALQSARGVEAILRDIVELVAGLMRTDSCSIFLYEDGALRLKAFKGEHSEDIHNVTVELGEGVVGEAALSGRPVAVVSEEGAPSFIAAFCDELLHSILSVPMMEEDNLIGVLNLHDHSRRQFTEMEKGLASFIATQLAGAIRNAQLQQEILRVLRDMATLHRVGQIVSSVLDEEELMASITQACGEHLNARGCTLRLMDGKTGLLELRSGWGTALDNPPRGYVEIGHGLPGKAALEQRPIITNDIENTPGVEGEIGLVRKSAICVPMIVKGRLMGTLAVFDRMDPGTDDISPFDESDMGLVNAIGAQAAMAIENAHLFDEARRLSEDKEFRIRELSLLLEITNIMRSSMDMEEILYIILTSVTMGQGLGFNRACLFLIDENERYLKGKMAVGPRTAEEARRHWESLSPMGKSLFETITEYGLFNMQAGYEIDRRVKEMRIPLHENEGVVALTAIKRQSYNVADYAAMPGSAESVLNELDFRTFAAVPLIARERVVGVVVVDNLITAEPITQDMINFLQLFANQAAGTIERARVYRNLEETNRRLVDARDMLVRAKTLATLGEFSAGVAHELRNPLVSIGGFARRLTKMLDSNSKEARYARIIATEVENLEVILSQILEFVAGGRAARGAIDVTQLFEQVFLLFREQLEKHNIELQTEYDDEVRFLNVDEVQIRQLFINLIKNAIEAMSETGGRLRIKSTRLHEETGGVGFEVADTGCGISSEDLERIFDPFFSRKARGTGLGLPMCSRIVEANHGGRMFVDSKQGQGTSVLVWFPEEAIVEPDAAQVQV